MDFNEGINWTHLQSGAKAPVWSVFNWCSNSVLLLILGLGAEAAGRLTPLAAGLAVSVFEELSVELLLLLTVFVAAAVLVVAWLPVSPSNVVVSIRVPIGDWMVDWVLVIVTLFVLLLEATVDTGVADFTWAPCAPLVAGVVAFCWAAVAFVGRVPVVWDCVFDVVI